MGTRILEKKKQIALIAHDNKKPELAEWAVLNKKALIQHELVGTGTTGKELEEALSHTITKLMSGPLGGDQQVDGSAAS